MPKLESSTWKLAAYHSLRGGLGIFISSLIGVTATAAFYDYYNSPLMLFILILCPVGVWLSGAYSAKYVNNTYIVHDATAIVRRSAIILFTLLFIVLDYSFINSELKQDPFVQQALGSIVVLLGVTLTTFIYYISSKKYLYNTPTTEENSYSLELSDPSSIKNRKKTLIFVQVTSLFWALSIPFTVVLLLFAGFAADHPSSEWPFAIALLSILSLPVLSLYSIINMWRHFRMSQY